MEIIAPVTDYVRESLLTTQGDLVKHGVAVNERMGVGLTNQLLKTNAAGNDLEYGPVFGTANQLLKVNADGNNLEYAKLVAVLFEHEYSTYNDSQIIITASITPLVSIDIGNVLAGDRILYNAYLRGSKGVTAGITDFSILKISGTAQVVFIATRTSISDLRWHTATNTESFIISGIIRVTTGGTATLRTHGISNGSNLDCNTGEAQLYLNVMKT